MTIRKVEGKKGVYVDDVTMHEYVIHNVSPMLETILIEPEKPVDLYPPKDGEWILEMALVTTPAARGWLSVWTVDERSPDMNLVFRSSAEALNLDYQRWQKVEEYAGIVKTGQALSKMSNLFTDVAESGNLTLSPNDVRRFCDLIDRSAAAWSGLVAAVLGCRVGQHVGEGRGFRFQIEADPKFLPTTVEVLLFIVERIPV